MKWFSIALASTLIAVPQNAAAQVRDSARAVYAGTAAVTGIVLAAGKETVPLRRAMVTLTRTGVEDIRTVATDDRGRYTFSDLPAGTFRLSAIKGGFIGMSWGAPKPGMPGRSIQLVDGQVYAAEPVALTRGGVIAGRLLDRNGRPAGSTTVEATQFITVGGERRRRIGAGSYGSAMTDDHGDYRIFGLLPGDYIVFVNYQGTPQTEATPAELSWAQQPTSVAPPQGRPFTYAPTLFPGVGSEVTATPVTLGSGEERLGVDFAPQYVAVSRITGLVTGPDGAPARRVRVERSAKSSSGILPSNSDATSTADDGTFVMTGVPPGDYVLWTRFGPLGQSARAVFVQYGRTEVSVAGVDVSDVSIRLQPAPMVSGAIVARGSGAMDFTRVNVQLVAVAGGSFSGSLTTQADTSGRFQIEGVPPGRYRVTATMPRGAESAWSLRSAMLGDRDLIDVPIEVQPGDSISGLSVTFGDARSELSGTISDAAGRAVAQLYVLVFSTDLSQRDSGSRRTSSVLANDNGAYAIQGLPPGEYYLCALTELDTTRVAWDPSYLEELVSASIKLALGDGEKKKQDLRVGK